MFDAAWVVLCQENALVASIFHLCTWIDSINSRWRHGIAYKTHKHDNTSTREGRRQREREGVRDGDKSLSRQPRMTFLCLSWIELELLALSVVLQAVSLASPDSSYLHATFIHVLNIAGGMSSLRKHIQSRATNTSYMHKFIQFPCSKYSRNRFFFRQTHQLGAGISSLCKQILDSEQLRLSTM